MSTLLCPIFLKVTHIPSPVECPSALFQSMLIGIAVLYLLGNYIGRFGSFVRFFMALGIIMAISFMGTLFYFSDFYVQTVILATFALMICAMFFGFVVSSKFCGKKYRPTTFISWLGLWLSLSIVFAVIGFVAVRMIITKSELLSEEMLIQLLKLGLCFGLFFYVVNLPFMILGFTSSFFHERFCACLNLKSMPAPAASCEARAGADSDSNQPDVQS